MDLSKIAPGDMIITDYVASIEPEVRGRMHTVGGIEMAKLNDVLLGDTVVVVFTEALVLSLKKI